MVSAPQGSELHTWNLLICSLHLLPIRDAERFLLGVFFPTTEAGKSAPSFADAATHLGHWVSSHPQ